MNRYLTYAKFTSENEAEDLCQFFNKNNIEFIIEQEKGILDKIIVGETFDHLFLLKIKESDFGKVGELIRTEFNVDASQINIDYYLFNFSNDELIRVFNSKDGWNYFDIALSKKLLEERNVSITQSEDTTNHLLSDQIRLANYILLIEYIISIAIGFAGIIIGLATLAAKKTSQNGQRINFYDSWTRKNAVIILFIGIIRSSLLAKAIFFSNN